MFEGEVMSFACKVFVGSKMRKYQFLIFILIMNSSTFSRFCMHEQTGTIVKIIWYMYLDTTGTCILSWNPLHLCAHHCTFSTKISVNFLKYLQEVLNFVYYTGSIHVHVCNFCTFVKVMNWDITFICNNVNIGQK